MYFILECYGPDEEDPTALGDWPHFDGVNWNLGRLIDKPIPTPIPIELDAQYPGIMMPMYSSGLLLFNDAMIAALHGIGVNNFQAFEAIVTDPINHVEYTNYKVINIIGVIGAADLGKSTYESADGSNLIDTDFSSLAIDENKAKGLPMFRLAESVNALVIHERVKKALEAAKIPYLDFVLPEEWIG